MSNQEGNLSSAAERDNTSKPSKMPELTSVESHYVRPRTRQRVLKQPPQLNVPNINDDAAERKRVLNVLAQRRYRERKRHGRDAGPAPSEDVIPSQATPSSQGQSGTGSADVEASADLPSQIDQNCFQIPDLPSMDDVSIPDVIDGLELDINSTWLPDSTGGLPVSSLLIDYDLSTQPPIISSAPSTIDPSALFDTSSSEDTTISFPDSYLLPVAELTLLRAFLRIATRIGCSAHVWDLAAESPFFKGTATPAAALPLNWQPTPSQVLMQHHPMLDFLPWPAVRDRIISIFNLPVESRPPAATGPLGLVQFAYDMEDTAEGVRIWGDDPYDVVNWEVGQLFFERWWFLFDNDIVEQSNRWRDLRGADRLKLAGGNGMVLGEV